MKQSQARHYEVMLMLHPDYADRNEEIIKVYRNLIKKNKGKMTREENWGRQKLAYPIKRQKYGYYMLFNFSSFDDGNLLEEIQSSFINNETIIRNLVTQTKTAISDESPMQKKSDEKEEKPQ